MASTSYTKQDHTEPAFPKLVWSKPETKRSAGKLLIIGGNANGIAAPLQSYDYAQKAGIGVSRVALPSALKSVAGKLIDTGTYVPSTPSGSFSKQALAELLESATWADSMVLAGDFGRNSETAMLLESLLKKSNTSAILSKDMIDYVATTPTMMERNALTVLVASLSQLQKLVRQSIKQPAISFDMNIAQLVEALKDISIATKSSIITKHHTMLFVAHEGEVSATDSRTDDEMWQVKTAAYASVWLAQQPEKPFAALTTAIFNSLQAEKAE